MFNVAGILRYMMVFIYSLHIHLYISGCKITCNDVLSKQRAFNVLYTGLRELHLSCIETFGRNMDHIKAVLQFHCIVLSYF